MERRDFLALLASLPSAALVLPGKASAADCAKAVKERDPRLMKVEVAYAKDGPPPPQTHTTIIHLHGEQFTASQVRELVEELNRCTRDAANVVLLP